MAFCTRCGRQTEGGQRTADGAELCLYCGELAAGPEIHHGYPGQRASRHGGPGDLYSRQNGPGNGYSPPAGAEQSDPAADHAARGCRVPLSDYPSLTDLPAVAVAWPTTSYSSRFRAGRHALPPERAPRRYAPVAAQLRVRPGPPEFEDGYPLPAAPSPLPSAQQPATPEVHAEAQARASVQDPAVREDQASHGRHALLSAAAGAQRVLTLARGSRWLAAATAGLVLVAGAATAALALGGHDPQTQLDEDGTQANGLVRAALPAAAGADEAQVLALLDRYFAAINAHDFARYRQLFSQALRDRLSAAAFRADYGSVTDSDATLRSITAAGPRRLTVLVTFSSRGQPASSSATSLCTDWTTWLYLSRHGHRYVLINPPSGRQPSGRSCG